MRLKPGRHREAAANLRELAAISTIPHERQSLLDKAALFEALAQRAEALAKR